MASFFTVYYRLLKIVVVWHKSITLTAYFTQSEIGVFYSTVLSYVLQSSTISPVLQYYLCPPSSSPPVLHSYLCPPSSSPPSSNIICVLHPPVLRPPTLFVS